jgi:hypothetical protein
VKSQEHRRIRFKPEPAAENGEKGDDCQMPRILREVRGKIGALKIFVSLDLIGPDPGVLFPLEIYTIGLVPYA